jgi:hypothetical protein
MIKRFCVGAVTASLTLAQRRITLGHKQLRNLVAERKAHRHLFFLYDANVPSVWNSYAAAFIFGVEIASQSAGAREFL